MIGLPELEIKDTTYSTYTHSSIFNCNLTIRENMQLIRMPSVMTSISQFFVSQFLFSEHQILKIQMHLILWAKGKLNCPNISKSMLNKMFFLTKLFEWPDWREFNLL